MNHSCHFTSLKLEIGGPVCVIYHKNKTNKQKNTKQTNKNTKQTNNTMQTNKHRAPH